MAAEFENHLIRQLKHQLWRPLVSHLEGLCGGELPLQQSVITQVTFQGPLPLPLPSTYLL